MRIKGASAAARVPYDRQPGRQPLVDTEPPPHHFSRLAAVTVDDVFHAFVEFVELLAEFLVVEINIVRTLDIAVRDLFQRARIE